MLDQILEINSEHTFVSLTGFDDAITGTTTDYIPVLIYSVSKCIEILMAELQCSREEALDYFYFNMIPPQGKNHPIFCDDDY